MQINFSLKKIQQIQHEQNQKQPTQSTMHSIQDKNKYVSIQAIKKKATTLTKTTL
jgi:hypothetical protein